MDVSACPERPQNVAVAVRLLYLSLGIAVLRWLWGWSVSGHSVGFEELAASIIVVTIFVWFYHVIGKGKNWARITFLVLLVIGLPLWVVSTSQFLRLSTLSMSLHMGLLIGDIAGIILQLAAVVLLFRKNSSEWFKATKNLREAVPNHQGSFQLVPASWLDAHFKKNGAGQTVFKHWGRRGRILPDTVLEAKVRRFLGIFAIVAVVSPAIVGALFGAPYILLVILLEVTWYVLHIRALVGDLPVGEVELKKEGARVRFAGYNKSTLWFRFTASALAFSLISFVVVLGPLSGGPVVLDAFVAICLLLLLGGSTVLWAYAIVIKYTSRLEPQAPRDA